MSRRPARRAGFALTGHDNGVGRPATGRDDSLGLKLNQRFGQRLKGDLTLSGADDAGTPIALRPRLAP